MRPRYSGRALRHIAEIEDYIAERSPAAARRVVDQIGDAIDRVQASPGIGRPGRRRGTREKVVVGTPYVIVYRVRGRQLEILAVFHGAQRR